MFIIYIFEIPLFAVALVFAFLLGGKISEPLMVASIVAIAGMGTLMICSIVKFCKEIKDNGYEKIQWFIGIVISLTLVQPWKARYPIDVTGMLLCDVGIV